MKHWLEYWLVACSARLVRGLPWRAVSAAGEWLGLAAYALAGGRRRIALDNLAQAFPGRAPEQYARLARRAFRHFGRMLLEFLKFSALSPAEMLSRVETVGLDNGRRAYAGRRGAFFLTAHFGSWEVDGLVHALALEPIGVLARRLDNPRLDALLERLRGRTGNRVIHRDGGLRSVLRALASGQGVAILIDQHVIGPGQVTVDFFGRPAATTTMLAAVALRTGAPIVPVFSIPGDPGRYRIVYQPAVEPPGPACADPVREYTQRCTAALEAAIREHPELWLWMHRRWRSGRAAEARDGEA